MRKGSGRLACAAVMAAVLIVVAATPAWADPTAAPTGLGQVVDRMRLWALGLLSAVATLFLILGGGRYIIAGGDPGEVERAKLAIKSALWGYALALLAPVLLTVLRGIVGG